MSTRCPTGSAPLDLSLFSTRLAGDINLMRELATLYIAEYPRQLEELRAAASSCDSRRLRLTAHTIRGTATNFAAAAALQAAKVLEEMGELGNASNSADAVETLTFELHRLHVALEAFLANS